MRLQRIGLVAAGFLAAATGCTGPAAEEPRQPAGPTPAHTSKVLPIPATGLGDTPRELLIWDAEQIYPHQLVHGRERPWLGAANPPRANARSAQTGRGSAPSTPGSPFGVH